MFNTDNELYFGIFATIIGSFFWLLFLRKRDKYEPEPLHAMLFVLIIGGLASTFFASLGNVWVDNMSDFKLSHVIANGGSASLSNVLGLFIPSAFIEEFCKYTAAFWLIRKNKQVNEPVDGIIYAVTVGLGFSLFENFLYAAQFGSLIVFPRLLFAVPLHMATAAIWGIYFSTTLAKNEKIVYSNAFPLFLLAVALHSAWNSSSVFLGGAFYLLAPFVLKFSLKRIDRVIENMHEYSPFKYPQTKQSHSVQAENKETGYFR
jgi:RsiW-degrading membrane proteinase PrsW (M82 family)